METENESLAEAYELAQSLRSEVGKIILGQESVVSLTLVVLLCRGHALFEGVPGVGKTLLVNTLARALDCDSSRVQFTPDLMPTDITGTNVFNFKDNAFNLIKGPIFTSFLLADEVNRSPAKTQAALLQAMQERFVTIDGSDYPLDKGFTVFATQNPVEYEGTYPLPEAQKDRFLLQINIEYPDYEDEYGLAMQVLKGDTPERRLIAGEVNKVCSLEVLETVSRSLEQVKLDEELIKYAVTISRKTREHEAALMGGGPRATMGLIASSRAWALLEGRDFVTPDDVKYMAPHVLKHRILVRPEFELEGFGVDSLVEQVFEETPVPR